MKINEWLNTQGIGDLDEETLKALEEFIGGSQLHLMQLSVEEAKKQHAFNQENMLTKREQFAGFAMMGMLINCQDFYGEIDDIKSVSYTYADAMLEKPDEDT